MLPDERGIERSQTQVFVEAFWHEQDHDETNCTISREVPPNLLSGRP